MPFFQLLVCRFLQLFLGFVVVIITSVTLHAQTLYDNYSVPLTDSGQPQIGGFWTNVTITPQSRSRALGDKLVYSAEEAAEIEARVEVEEAEASQATDPDAPADFQHERSVALRPEFAAAGGATGFYNRFWLDPGSHLMRVSGEPRTSIFTTKNGQAPARIKGAPRGRTLRGGSSAGYESRGLGERCIIGFGRNGGPPMFANGFYNNNYQIVQSPDHIMILVEMIHDARIIRLNSKHREDNVRPWFGDSIGWWEEKTLVVETTHIPEKQAYYGAWKNLTVTERFTRVAKDRLHYRFVVEDSTVWKNAWGGEYEFSPMDGQIYEYACHEGNYALPGILKGLQ